VSRFDQPDGFEFRPTDPLEPIAVEVLREYFREILIRYYRRPATDAEVTMATDGDPSYGLTPPDGVFLLAVSADVVHGCAGLRLVDDQLGEVKRVYVRPSARGRHLASTLMDEIEGRARSAGLAALRLDTRSELSEAIAMYGRRGYRDIAPFPGSGFADVWMRKDLLWTGAGGPASAR
jgi:ribosomal protein S18 acetylase RimI-like enzyme